MSILYSRLTVMLGLMIAAPWVVATDEPVSTGFIGNTAVGGHDVTVYHQLASDDKAIKGEKVHTVKWKGADWHFVSEEDSKKFAANPEKFAPAYNGHCANALSLGEGLIRTNGKYWAIFDEQLYLFFAPRGAKRWQAASDYREYKTEADRAWREILADR